MAGAGVPQIILFIGALIVATSVAVVLVGVTEDAALSMDSAGDGLAEELQSDIVVVSDPGSGAVYDDGSDEVTLLVKNTGDEELTGSSTFVLINGEYHEPDSVEVQGDTDAWRSGDVAELTVEDVDLDTNQEHRFVVHAGSADDEFEAFIEG